MEVLVLEDHSALSRAWRSWRPRGHRARRRLRLPASAGSPCGDGDEVLPSEQGDDEWRSLVDAGERAVLMLTAAETVKDRIEGLRVGAYDYTRGPFHVPMPVGSRSAER